VAFDFFIPAGAAAGAGVGVHPRQEGHILTNNHVIDNAQQVEVTLSNKQKYKATVVGGGPAHDLALLQITTRRTWCRRRWRIQTG
jgi:S1-C subfamily serine protease